MEITILVWIFFSIYLSIAIGKFLIRKSNTFKFKKSNQDGIRFSSQTKPIYGGVIFYVIFVISVIFSLMISTDDQTVNQLFTFLLVGTIGFFIGLADDLVSPSPFFKFFGQTLVASVLVFMGMTVQISTNEIVNAFITFLWVVGIMNSINLLDNMDAISTSITSMVLIAVLVILLMSESINFPLVILLSGTIGSLLGFLRFNWNPAKMYMGDNGSQFLGAILAIVGVQYFWNSGLTIVEISISKSFWATTLAFIIPITDTTTVFINRIAQGKSPFVGGSDHTTHHLYYLGLSVKQVALLLNFLTIISLSLSVYIIKFVEEWSMTHNFVFGAYSLILFTLIYSTTKISKPKEQKA